MGILGWLAQETFGEKLVGTCKKCGRQIYASKMGFKPYEYRECCNALLCRNCDIHLSSKWSTYPKERCPCCSSKSPGYHAEFWADLRASDPEQAKP